MDIKKLEDRFDEEEIEILKSYLEGKSIRQLATEHKNFGRTKIRNLIERCRKEIPEFLEIINKKLVKDKLHKKDDDDLELRDLTEEEIAQAYEEIKSGITLTEVSNKLGRTKDFLKKRILEYINNPEEENEFLELLKSNQHPKSSEEIFQLSEQEIKQTIFERLNNRRRLKNRPPYSEKLLEKKYQKMKKYFLETRNQSIEHEEDKITEDQFLKMLYDTPTILSSSLENKIIPAMENLDNHVDLGFSQVSKIIKEDASILCSSIERTNLQLRILTENGLLKNCVEKPRNFRTSPEMLYALIELYKNNAVSTDSIFITKTQLQQKYKITPEQLLSKYDIRKKYGDDPYFERE